jgi:hypothetical protein
MKLVNLYQPSEDSNDFYRERLFEREFITPREQRMAVKMLINRNEDCEIETLNEYVVACTLFNCIGKKDIELQIFKEDIVKDEYVKIEVDNLMYWKDEELYRNMSDIIDMLSEKRLSLIEEGE